MVFISDAEGMCDSFAAFVGMLPFRGVATALVSFKKDGYGSLQDLVFESPSGVMRVDSKDSARMGLCPLARVFGPLPSNVWAAFPRSWDPFTSDCDGETDLLPFAIAGLRLPMLTFKGQYESGVVSLAQRIVDYYAEKACDFYPVVSCGQTVDRLGYGVDIAYALAKAGYPGWYFRHRSGETYKRYDEYGDQALLNNIKLARAANKRVVMIAVGGGVNGNSTGLLASLTGADFIEIPTTPMHYNDATTSAKKAFSLVVDDTILSKNILGCFYLPKLVFCINDCLLTISSASAHATVGEACKTMNMLGIADSEVGKRDYSNIMGAGEFASDFTKIVLTVDGFEALVNFILDESTQGAKARVLEIGDRIATLRAEGTTGKEADPDSELAQLIGTRADLMREYRDAYHKMPTSSHASNFLTTINHEIVKAKAMFLASSDPFEKYRALLFEYAHTLGHGVEALMNDLYTQAKAKGIDYQDATKLHGQFVGMAVQWAGAISSRLGVLEGQGLALHQAFVYLFNRFGGFSFAPLRSLCDKLSITEDDFCEGVLKVVRRDNKRGYTKCGCGKSVDQLVCGRPGKMLRSEDPEAELRYLVEVDEEWQRDVLRQAFRGEFDLVADLPDRRVSKASFRFKPVGTGRVHQSLAVAECLRSKLEEMYQADLKDPQEYIKPVPPSRRNKGKRPLA